MLKKVKKISKHADCHPDKKLYALKMCRSCYEKELRNKNPDFAKNQQINCKKWMENNLEKKRLSDKNWRAKQDKQYIRDRNFIIKLSKLGITLEEYNNLVKIQNGKCAICLKSEKNKKLAIDHDHKTGKIRGLLCFRCNFGMTWFNENADNFDRALTYLTINFYDFSRMIAKYGDIPIIAIRNNSNEDDKNIKRLKESIFRKMFEFLCLGIRDNDLLIALHSDILAIDSIYKRASNLYDISDGALNDKG